MFTLTFSFFAGSKARRVIIDRIRKKGQFLCNTDATINSGVLLPSRRQNKKFKKTAADYISCASCYGSYSSSSLRVHFKRCTDNLLEGERVVRALGRACEGRLHADACQELNEVIFARMRQTKFLRLVRFDWLVVCYGNILCLNFSPHFQQGHIRNKMRSAARVLFAAKSISSSVTDFSSLYHVSMCNTVIEAIRFVAKFDSKSKQFGSPATASALVTLINTIGDLLVVESMKVDDAEKERSAERFLKVFQKEVRLKINKLVAVQQAKARRRKKKNIPTTDDIHTLATYLDSEREKCFADLSKKFSYDKWSQLSELTLVSILLFNRRRTGEMMNLTLDDYKHREMVDKQSTASMNTVPEEIKQRIKSRIEPRGKRDGRAPILLKHTFESCLEILIHYREKVGIPKSNDFIFALPSKTGQIRTVNACNALLSFSIACGAENPSSLRGTLFRKHMATFSSTKNLSDNDITNLASFMGHSDKIHREYYRHNPFDREVTQMTPLLEAAQGHIVNITTTTDAISKHDPKKTAKKRKQVSSSKLRKNIAPDFSSVSNQCEIKTATKRKKVINLKPRKKNVTKKKTGYNSRKK